jgi:hypothetical protein
VQAQLLGNHKNGIFGTSFKRKRTGNKCKEKSRIEICGGGMGSFEAMTAKEHFIGA